MTTLNFSQAHLTSCLVSQLTRLTDDVVTCIIMTKVPVVLFLEIKTTCNVAVYKLLFSIPERFDLQ